MQYNNILKFFIIVLVLGTTVVWATETTWRHSGFEVSGYDINFSQVYNITNLRVLNFGWNSSIPAVSAANKATMYYDDNAKQIKYSVNGGAYQQINDVSNAIGGLPNASIPASAVNYSDLRMNITVFTRDTSLGSGTQILTNVGFKPTSVDFLLTTTGYSDAFSIGYDNGVTPTAMLHRTSTGYISSQYGGSLEYVTGDTTYYWGKIQSFDANGATIIWTNGTLPPTTLKISAKWYR